MKTCFTKGEFQFLASISTDYKLAIWRCENLLNFSEDLEELKADRVVKSKTRLTCISISNLNEIKLGKREKKDKKLQMEGIESENEEKDESEEEEKPAKRVKK